MPALKPHLKVFLSYTDSDSVAVRDLYLRLTRDGIEAWFDQERLLPGQDWEREIRKAVREADVVIVCLSECFHQAGIQQKEVRLALDTALEQPEGEIFIVPARLEQCENLESLRRWECVDLFEVDGYERLIRALNARAYSINTTLHIHRDQSAPIPGPTSEESGKVIPAHDASVNAAGDPIDTGGHTEARQQTTRGETTAKNGDRQSGPVEKTGTGQKNRRQAVMRMLFRLFASGKYLRPYSRYLIILAVVLLLFLGSIMYEPITGHPLFAAPFTATALPTLTFTSTPTYTPTSTLTPTPVEPTLTPVPATATAIATDTLIPTVTAIPPVPLGQDWLAGCISTLWRPYPADIPAFARGDGCWKEPLHVFSAENGDLDFLAHRKTSPVDIYGLFAPLPEKGTVTVKVRLKDLENVDLWVGIFAEPDFDSPSLLMTIPTGNVQKRVFVQRDPLTYRHMNSTTLIDQGNGFSFSFKFTVNSARCTINKNVFATSSVSIPSERKWLFLGYKALGGAYRVEGRFLSFELSE